MNLDAFIEQRRPAWEQMETLLAQATRDTRRLSAADLSALARLYRSATADLALAQRDFPGQQVTAYLNQLVGRAHAAIHRDEPLRWAALRDFYRAGFPALYRHLLPYTTVAFGLFMAAALAAFFTVWRVPDAIYVIAGEGIAPLVEEVERGELWTEIAPTVRSAAASLILTNNIRVMFLMFAGGVTAGLFTGWILLSNGLHIGAVFGLLQAHGLAGGLADFVVAHGFIELSVIFLAGGCGLFMGDGIIRPGLRSRRAVLVERARVCVKLILGCVPLLVAAGIIEGFISPSGLPFAAKLATGLATGLALHGYWLRAGREAAAPRRVHAV